MAAKPIQKKKSGKEPDNTSKPPTTQFGTRRQFPGDIGQEELTYAMTNEMDGMVRHFSRTSRGRRLLEQFIGYKK